MRSLLTSVVPFVTFGLSHLRVVEAFEQCYYPDGSIPTDWIWEPCTGAQYSSCCVPGEGDICQPDGLCYYPAAGLSYRGTCTDRTWNDPSCNADICVTGFETTWNWAIKCDGAGGAETWACGIIDDYGHESPTSITCPANKAAQTAGSNFVTTRSTTSAARYTPPPTVDPKVYSVFTSSYTATLSASQESTTRTTTYASTFTSKISAAAATTTGSGVPIPLASNSTSSNMKSAVTLSIGALVGIIITVIALLTIGLITAVILRNKRLKKKEDPIRLDTASPPPPNGPVGRDQIYPYEAPANEVGDVEKLKRQHGYVGPKVDTYEIDDHSVHGRGEKSAAMGMGAGRMGVAEMRGDYGEPLRSPAPEYSVAVMPVELDASPAPSRGENRPYGRY
ncbi:hypothetical protein BGZ57DRAFT_145966 [Hyaloscypha finlandica]|nr:hypothetical protein F5882DRAFT_416238 [Hyaloscypha sp. PMI_1271]KAH8786905.1 hypothetical protein BGZ57DRAFT_145966 [Hyaloscypha finlandica]